MVASCLQKEPDKRPPAGELLKHPFLKKARDMEFLKENLVPLAPSLSSRLKKPVRVPGASGRLKRGPEGTWEWEDADSEEGRGGEENGRDGVIENDTKPNSQSSQGRCDTLK